MSLKDNNLYLGYTSNLERRMKQHESGLTKSTKSRRPLKLIYYEAHLSKEDAMRRELYFKTTAGKRTIRLMLRDSLSQFKTD